MLRVLLVDDEAAARRGFQILLKEHDDVEVIGEADSVSSATVFLQNETPDLIFLDVEMPGARGFSLLDSLPSQVQVIMVTAHASYALEAFDYQAFDYLLKPVHPERLSKSLDRYRNAVKESLRSIANGSLTVKSQGGVNVLLYRKISALLAEGDYTSIVMDGETDCFIMHSIGYYEKVLPSPPFVRLSRSLIVNLNQIISLDVRSRDSADLFLKGVSEPLSLRRSAIQKLRLQMK